MELLVSTSAPEEAQRTSTCMPMRLTPLTVCRPQGLATHRFCATGECHPTGGRLPAFDRVCADNHIEHRLIKPRRPQTNGMVERFNGRIADVLRTHRFGLTGRAHINRCCRIPDDYVDFF